MRVATLVGPEGVEVSISEAGGSPQANANRWLGQVGRPALDPAGFAELPRLQSGLGEAVVVEGTGPSWDEIERFIHVNLSRSR